MTPDNIKEVVLYAWVGEDELSELGGVGLKQAYCAAGCIPMVSVKEDRMDQDYIKEQLQNQTNKYGKTIRLCKFVFKEELIAIEPVSRN